MYKLIASDIDGTLLNSKGELTKNTKEAIYEAVDKNLIVLPCSGRGPIPMKMITNQLDRDIPIACFNGGLVIKGKSGEIIYERAMKKEDVIVAYEVGVKKGVGVIIWTLDSKLAINEWNKYTTHYHSISGIPKEDVVLIPDHPEIFDDRIAKVLWEDEEKNIDKNVEEGRKLVKEKMPNSMCASSQAFLLEFTDEKATKAIAIKEICDIFNIKHEDTIAIGDGLNDVPMIEYANLGVAMANSHKEVLEKANLVGPSNDEDGVAYIIKKYMLGE